MTAALVNVVVEQHFGQRFVIAPGQCGVGLPISFPDVVQTGSFVKFLDQWKDPQSQPPRREAYPASFTFAPIARRRRGVEGKGPCIVPAFWRLPAAGAPHRRCTWPGWLLWLPAWPPGP